MLLPMNGQRSEQNGKEFGKHSAMIEWQSLDAAKDLKDRSREVDPKVDRSPNRHTNWHHLSDIFEIHME